VQYLIQTSIFIERNYCYYKKYFVTATNQKNTYMHLPSKQITTMSFRENSTLNQQNHESKLYHLLHKPVNYFTTNQEHSLCNLYDFMKINATECASVLNEANNWVQKLIYFTVCLAWDQHSTCSEKDFKHCKSCLRSKTSGLIVKTIQYSTFFVFLSALIFGDHVASLYILLP
jgi:hypothetical protein